MPKNRKRALQPGAKSASIRTKFKLGTRKSSVGLKQLSDIDLSKAETNCLKKDKAMVKKVFVVRSIKLIKPISQS
jgi:hypothetical protein